MAPLMNSEKNKLPSALGDA